MLMVDPAVKAGFSRLQMRWRDPLLTTLTIMLAVMLFVLAPLQATGIVKSETFARLATASAGRASMERNSALALG